MRGFFGAAALLCGLGAAGGAQARCEHDGYTIVPSRGDRAEVTMRAESGKDCVIRLAATRRFTVTARRIVEQPAQGHVSIEGETAFYRSLPDFRGADRFVAEIDAKGSDGEGTSTLVVRVEVR